MRTKKEIEQDSRKTELLLLEVLLDIRELLKKEKNPVGRPRKNKGV